jgi:hypothetical protein
MADALWDPNDDSKVEGAIGVVKGRVEIHYPQPRSRVVFDSENARMFGEMMAKAAYEARYGVYSETPDHMPLVGVPHPDSRVCYLLGCNAWGQASLSFASSLVPSLLGLREFTPSQNVKRQLLLGVVIIQANDCECYRQSMNHTQHTHQWFINRYACMPHQMAAN